MAGSASWPLVPPAAPPPEPPVSAPTAGMAAIPAGERAYLGYGLLRPFVRDAKQDFANAGGVKLVAAAVGQVLGTVADTGATVGELPWRTDFGSALELLRHRNPDRVFDRLVQAYVIEALQRWEPRVLVRSSEVIKDIVSGETRVRLRVVYDVAASNTPGSEVVATDLSTDLLMS